MLEKIDEVATRTLKNCMQQVFEDGPKRDRRLWLGDLYLQAKANFYPFKNYNLVKRCLYLFAGLTHQDVCLSSAVFHEPTLRNQDWIIHDYALYFIGILYDCYMHMEDFELVKELWHVAFRQTEIVSAALKPDGSVEPSYYFIDWCPELDKTAAAQGILVKMLKKARFLAELVGTKEEIVFLEEQIVKTTKAAMDMFDENLGLFVSGDSKQVSWVSQSHMILEYWGGMVKKGADCFWEVYIPSNPEASPYGYYRINSYCHAWSCTPTYFIRKYFHREEKNEEN